MKNEIINILGTKITNISYQGTINYIEKCINSKKPHHICTVNPEYIITAQKDPELMYILNNSDLNVADGSGLLFAAKYTNQKLNYKVTGVDLFNKIAYLSNKKNYKIFLLGGINNTAQKTAQIIKKKYPRCNIVGNYEGFPDIKPISKKIFKNNYNFRKTLDFDKNPILTTNNLKIIQKITSKKPDILFVAYGCPKQDKFIARFKKYLNVPVMIGVGGTFDFISGKIKRAPSWMRSIHLEWLYRLFKEPKRFKRIYTATIKFPLKIIFNKK